MSASQISYRVNKRFSPHLESLGFGKSVQSRQWVKVEDDILCAVHMVKSPLNGKSYEDVSPNSFKIYVGVAYDRLHLGNSPSFDPPELQGIGVCRVRAALTRSEGVVGPKRTDIWDAERLSPDEAIADSIVAFDAQAVPFFESWTDLEFAYGALQAGGFTRITYGTSTQGAAETFVSAAPTSTTYQNLLAELAARLGRVDEEAACLERIIDLGGGGEAHKARLAKLRSS